MIMDPVATYEYSLDYWSKRVKDPHPRVTYFMKDTADLLVKVGVTNCLYDRMKHRRLGGHVPYEYVLVLDDPKIERLFKLRFAHLIKETSGTETFYAAKEIREWIEWVNSLPARGHDEETINHLIYESLEVQ